MRNENLILLTDSYKLSHAAQYPPNTTNVYSYFESRTGARFPNTVFVGLQALIKRYLLDEVVTRQDVRDASEFAKEHMGPGIFNYDGWMHIVDRHAGRLPIKIYARPEGSVNGWGTPLMAVENTDPECFWLTNALETLLSHVWYPSTVATLSREIKGLLRSFLTITGCEDVDGTLAFMLHDFAGRGFTSMEAAGMGGLGHIVNFSGTDTLPAITYAQRYYGASMPAFSVPASEHSTMTSWGEAGEGDAIENMLDQYPTGVVSIVSDSWDLKRAARDIFGGRLRDKILARDGRVVVRPDSGDPVTVNMRLFEILQEKFGSTVNSAGYRVLPTQVRILQGDGMDMESVQDLLVAASNNGIAAENWVFGMGGGLMQRGLDRDTQRFAFKCSSAIIDGVERDVFKRPATDPTKNSKRGRFPELELIYANGTLLRDQSWDSVKENAAL